MKNMYGACSMSMNIRSDNGIRTRIFRRLDMSICSKQRTFREINAKPSKIN